jgi:hypothetical protein
MQIWQDSKHLCAVISFLRGVSASLSNPQCSSLLGQLAECPLLQKIVQAFVWGAKRLSFSALRHLLNVSNDELLDTIYRLRRFFGEDASSLSELSLPVIHSSSTWRPNISMDLALGCIRVPRMIKAENLPEYVWWVRTLNFMMVIVMVGQVLVHPLGSFHQRIPMLN